MSHRTIRRWIPLVAVSATLAVALWGCTSGIPKSYRTTSPETGVGQVALNMGASGDVQSAVAPSALRCTFESIRTFPVCAEGCDPAELLTQVAMVDVMSLSEANAVTVVNADLAIGDYENLSLRLAGVTVVVDGQEFPVQICPEGSMVDVTTLFSIAEGQTTELRVDFDRSSISYDEATGSYVLCPKIDGGGDGDGDDDGGDDGNGDDDSSSGIGNDDGSGNSHGDGNSKGDEGSKDDDGSGKSGDDKSGKSGDDKSGKSGKSGSNSAAGGVS